MSNGEVCCILGVCCPPAKRKAYLADALYDQIGISQHDATAVADWFVERFDVAPKGTLDPLIQTIADHARKHTKG